MIFVIRDGQPAERAALEDLQRRASLMWNQHRAYLLANPDAIALPLAHLAQGRVRVAAMAGKPAGFAALLPRPGGVADLDGLFVEPALWRRGIGRALVCDALARLAPGAILAAVAHPGAQGFYEKLGFVRVGVVQTQFGQAERMCHGRS